MGALRRFGDEADLDPLLVWSGSFSTCHCGLMSLADDKAEWRY
jgi:hypothetical protein